MRPHYDPDNDPEREPPETAAVRCQLLPHESWCQDCAGDRSGRICETCDGAGVVVTEKRVEHPDVRIILDELLAAHREPLIRALREAGKFIESRTAEVNALHRENAALRIVVRDQARLLDQAEPRAVAS